MVDDLSDFSKGQAFECFHCYKQVHIIIACNVCILFIRYLSLLLLPFLLIVYFCMYVFFSFDATILVTKDVYYKFACHFCFTAPLCVYAVFVLSSLSDLN